MAVQNPPILQEAASPSDVQDLIDDMGSMISSYLRDAQRSTQQRVDDQRENRRGGPSQPEDPEEVKERRRLSDALSKAAEGMKGVSDRLTGGAGVAGIAQLVAGPLGPLITPLTKLTDGIGGRMKDLFQKRREEGKGLFGSGKKFQGTVNRQKIKDIDPGSVYLGDKIEDNMGEKKGGFLGNFLKLLGSGGLIAAGVGFLLSGLTDDGPFKGLKKVVGRFLAEIGQRLFTRFIKPFKGVFDNILKFGRGLLDKIWKPMRGLLDNVLKFGKTAFGGILERIGKTGFGKVFKKVFKFIGKKAGKLAKVLKFVPGIGSIVSIGFAISRFKQGDIIGGIIELGAGIADLIPGVGTAISWGLDLFLAARDLGAFKEGGAIKGNVLDVFKKLWAWVKEKGGPIFKAIGSTISNLFTGAIDWVSDKVGELIAGARNIVKIGADWIKDKVMDPVLTWVGEKIAGVQEVTGRISAWVDEKIMEPIRTVISKVEEFVKPIWDLVSGWVTHNILNPIRKVFDDIRSAISPIWDQISGWVDEKVIQPVKGFLGKIGELMGTFRLSIASAFATLNPTMRNGGERVQAQQSILNSMGITDSQISDLWKEARNQGETANLSRWLLNMEGEDRGVLWNRLKGLADSIESVDDAIIRPSGQIIRTHPNDTIIATQNPVIGPGMENSARTSIQDTQAAYGASRSASMNDVVETLRELIDVVASQDSAATVVQQNMTSRFASRNLLDSLVTEVQ